MVSEDSGWRDYRKTEENFISMNDFPETTPHFNKLRYRSPPRYGKPLFGGITEICGQKKKAHFKNVYLTI